VLQQYCVLAIAVSHVDWPLVGHWTHKMLMKTLLDYCLALTMTLLVVYPSLIHHNWRFSTSRQSTPVFSKNLAPIFERVAKAIHVDHAFKEDSVLEDLLCAIMCCWNSSLAQKSIALFFCIGLACFGR
jgi:hypothetical protein